MQDQTTPHGRPGTTAFLTPKIVMKSIGSSPIAAPHAPVGDDPMDFTTIFGVRGVPGLSCGVV